MGKQWKQCQTLFFWAPKSLQMVTAAMKLKDAYSLEGVMTNLDSIFKRRDITLPTNIRLVKTMVFPVLFSLMQFHLLFLLLLPVILVSYPKTDGQDQNQDLFPCVLS